MTSHKILTVVSLTVTLLMTLPVRGLEEYNVLELREMTDQGVTSLDYIMGLVMMGLPADLTTKVKADLQSRAAGGFGAFGTATSGGKSRIPSAQSPPEAASTNQSENAGTDGPTIQNIDSSEPIDLGKRRKRSFDNFFNSGYGGGSNFAHPGFGDTGYGGTGFGGSGFGGKNTVVHPPENGNLYGGNARSYINYPGAGTGTHPYGNSGYKSQPFHFGGSQSLQCPRQVDQGFVYAYSADPLPYPAVEIANELFVRSLPGSDLLFQTLSRQIVFPAEPPQIFVDPFILTANATCRNIELQLWSYESQTFTGRCWPLVNFQEVPFYKTCLNRFCKCKPQNDFYNRFNNNKANVCITEYETLSLYSYCEQLIVNRRIVRDRIIVPDACTCSTIDCFPEGFYHK